MEERLQGLMIALLSEPKIIITITNLKPLLRELEDHFNQTDFLVPVFALESLLMNALKCFVVHHLMQASLPHRANSCQLPCSSMKVVYRA